MIFPLVDEIKKHTPSGFNKNLRNRREAANSDTRVSQTFWRTLAIGLFVVAIFFVLLARAISVQIISQDEYIALAKKNRIREFTILSERGIIFDKNGEQIARNKPSFSVELNILDCIKPDGTQVCSELLDQIQHHIKFDRQRVNHELDQRKTQLLLATGLTRDEILALEANIKNFPGLSISVAPSREYLYKEAFAHLLGYTGLGETLTPTIVGKTGIEEYYNNDLSGVAGAKIVQVDSAGTHYTLITQKDALPGKNVTLFADKDLQIKAYELLKEKVDDNASLPSASGGRKESGVTGGVVVAQDTATGGILALVSYPSFDPNVLSSGISSKELTKLNADPNFPFFNRAIAAVYPPGSTFKMVTATAVLAEKIADAALTIFDRGYIQVGGSTFRNWKPEGHGEVNLLRALQVSNDTYFYTVGGGYGGVNGLGIRKLHEWATKFGFGQKTGIDLNGEVSGFMPDGTLRDWYLGDDYISAIGQGDILATPLQTNNMVTYFANGGFLFKPRIVESIDGVGESEVVVLQQNIISEDHYDLIRQGMNLALSQGGTGYPVFDFGLSHRSKTGEPIKLAGKTGTSEYVKSDGKPGTHAWFTVFGPYKDHAYEQASLRSEDKPIVLTVFLEGGGGGADDAAPIARKLLDLWFEK